MNSALQILTYDVLTYIEEHDCFDLPKDVYCKVLKDGKIYGVELKVERIAVDSPERYNLAQKAEFMI